MFICNRLITFFKTLFLFSIYILLITALDFALSLQVIYYSLSNYHLQHFIYGTEYSVDLYISPHSKKVISVVPRIRLDVLGGEAVKSMTIWDEALIDLSMIVAKKSGLVGPIVIQFIRDNNTKIDYHNQVIL